MIDSAVAHCPVAVPSSGGTLVARAAVSDGKLTASNPYERVVPAKDTAAFTSWPWPSVRPAGAVTSTHTGSVWSAWSEKGTELGLAPHPDGTVMATVPDVAWPR